MDTKLQSHITQVISTKFDIYTRTHLMDKLTVVCPMVALSTGHLSIMDLILQSHINQSFPLLLIMDKLTVVLQWQPSLVDTSL
jgi:hypothetical protein